MKKSMRCGTNKSLFSLFWYIHRWNHGEPSKTSSKEQSNDVWEIKIKKKKKKQSREQPKKERGWAMVGRLPPVHQIFIHSSLDIKSADMAEWWEGKAENGVTGDEEKVEVKRFGGGKRRITGWPSNSRASRTSRTFSYSFGRRPKTERRRGF